MIRQTSLDAYHAIEANGRLSAQQRRLMLFMHSFPRGTAMNRRQISELSGMPINAVTGRINSLVEKGWLEDLPAEIDPVTERWAHPVRVKSVQPELELVAA